MKALVYGGPGQIEFAECTALPGPDGAIVRVTAAGVCGSDLPLAQVNELEFHIGLCSIQCELPALLRLTAANRLRPEAVVSHTLPLSDRARSYRMFADRADNVCKTVLDASR